MIIELQIRDINPRHDTLFAMRQVEEFINKCDPDDRVDLQIQVVK